MRSSSAMINQSTSLNTGLSYAIPNQQKARDAVLAVPLLFWICACCQSPLQSMKDHAYQGWDHVLQML